MRRARRQSHVSAQFPGARNSDGTRTRGSHIFSRARRLWELESPCSMHALPLAGLLLSCARAVLRRSSNRACKDLSSICQGVSKEPLGEYLCPDFTFCVYSRSNASLCFGPNLGCLWNSSHASSFLSRSRCLSSARKIQRSRSVRGSPSFMSSNLGRIEALSLSVALTKKLNASSTKAATS